MTQNKREFQLNLPGLLKILAEHLYSTKKVAVRELIQNAQDSTVRRASESRGRFYKPRIDIMTVPDEDKLIIMDNGSGMTEDEIITYLTTIGNSYTRELGDKLEFLSPEQASQLIGQFGLGFLSAFLIASDVTLTTRSYKADTVMRWYCDGSEFFDLTPLDDTSHEVGTRVEITLKPEAQFLLEGSVLLETVRQYADFVSVPIHINRDLTSANIITPPWDAYNKEQALQDYIERVFHQRDPIAVIELTDHEIDFGHDSVVIPLRGFVYVPMSSNISVREYGDLRVYIRGMFILENDRKLLPPWAKFMRGVVDCPALHPTASREDIHQEESYLMVQKAIEAQLLDAMRDIADNDPETWKHIVISHAALIRSWVVANDEFFDKVGDVIPLSTTRGRLTLREYLALTDNKLYYVSEDIGSLQERLLGEGYEVPVIEAQWIAVLPFLEKYASRHPGTRLVQMDGDARDLMRPVEDPAFDPLLEFYRAMGVKVRVAAYKPHTVPGLMLFPRNAKTIQNVRQALDSGDIAGPFAAMFEAYLDHQDRANANDDALDARGELYLNASSALVRRLVENPPAQEERDHTLMLIYQMARLFGGRHLSPQEAAEAFGTASESIEGLF